MKETVLITGGTGLVGKVLSKQFILQGYKVAILTRNLKTETATTKYYKWNIEANEIDVNCIAEADYIIHLVGENVAGGMWTAKQKDRILSSRVNATELLYKTLSENKNKVKAFVSASATGYYGTYTSTTIFKEEDAVGNDFLANVCEQWEEGVTKISSLGIRTLKLRTGVVLGSEKSALQKMLFPFQLGLGSAIGSGKQIMPWIHINDLCALYIWGLKNANKEGVYNAVVGDFLTNKELGKAIAKQLNKPFFMPNIPAFIMCLVFGEMAVILIEGSGVSSEKIKKEGFVFKYPTIETALEDLLG